MRKLKCKTHSRYENGKKFRPTLKIEYQGAFPTLSMRVILKRIHFTLRVSVFDFPDGAFICQRNMEIFLHRRHVSPVRRSNRILLRKSG